MSITSDLYQNLVETQQSLADLEKRYNKLAGLCQTLLDAHNEAPADSILSTNIERAIVAIGDELA